MSKQPLLIGSATLRLLGTLPIHTDAFPWRTVFQNKEAITVSCAEREYPLSKMPSAALLSTKRKMSSPCKGGLSRFVSK